MPKNKKSFFDRLTGNSAEETVEKEVSTKKEEVEEKKTDKQEWLEEETDGQLTIDMHHTPTKIIIQTMVAGVKPEDLDVSITQDMITIRGKRQSQKEVTEDNYYYQELYWGGFSRSIMLPHEVDADNANAKIKNGLLRISLPKINKDKVQKLNVKTE